MHLNTAFIAAVAGTLLSSLALAQTINTDVMVFTDTSCNDYTYYYTFNGPGQCTNVGGNSKAFEVYVAPNQTGGCYLRIFGEVNCGGDYTEVGPLYPSSGYGSCIDSSDPDTGAFRTAFSIGVFC